METWFTFGETSLSGHFADGPDLKVHTESERIGNCRLVTYAGTACIPACTPTELCVEGECRAWPTRVDHGTLHWVWPDGDKMLEPSALLTYYGTGAASTLGGASINVGGMTLEAPTVDRPKADGDWSEILHSRQAGTDAVLRWTNPVANARVRVYMTDCIGSHGGFAPAEIECEGPDTGELVLPGTFLDTLEAGDWTHGDCGSHTFERYHSGTVVGDDSVRFETVSDAGFFYFPD